MARTVTATRTEYTCIVRETRLVTVTYERKILGTDVREANLAMNNDMAKLWADIEDSNKGMITIGAVHE